MPTKNFSELKYKDAVKLMDSSTIQTNHTLLDSTVESIEDSTLICENPEIELIPMRTKVFYLIPDFLVNPIDDKIIELKKDIFIYKGGYESLCKRLNDFIDKISKSLQNLLDPSNILKNKINQIIEQFEDTVKSLCTPLYSEQEGLDNSFDKNKLSEKQKDEFNEDKLSIVYKVNEFKKESENLNKQYYKLFSQIYKAVQDICNTIKEIPSSIMHLQDQIEDAMSNFEEILEEFTEIENYDNFHELLLKVKESFELINNEMDRITKKIEEKIKNLDIQFKKRENSFNYLKEESKKTIEKLNMKSSTIFKNIKEVRDKYKQKELQLPENYIVEIIKENLFQQMNESIKCIKKVNESVSEEVKEMKEEIIYDLIPKTSLDLLYLMDTTGSMEQYVDITKEKLKEIMNKIINECPGVDINLGFIGYKDVAEIKIKDYLDIDFTSDHESVKKQIESINVGGGDDTAEDVAWAFEKAIEKNWTSNARFAILVGDAPCHGLDYHEKDLMDDYPEGVPNRKKKIEDLVEEIAQKNISLICIRLKSDTDIMYKKFKNIYKKYENNKNYEKNDKNNLFFDIVSIDNPEKLADEVTKNAVKAYKNQRLNHNKEIIVKK